MKTSAWLVAAAVMVLAGCGETTKSEDARASDGPVAANDVATGKDASAPEIASDSPGVQPSPDVAADLPADAPLPDTVVQPDRAAPDRAPDRAMGADVSPDLAVAPDLASEAGKSDVVVAVDGEKPETSAPDNAARLDVAADSNNPDLAPADVALDVAEDVAVSDPEPPDVRCRNDADCCIAIDNCMATAYLYSKAPGASAPPTFRPNDSGCLACIPPAVQVHCESGQCVGEKLSSSVMWQGKIVQDHCGPVALPDAGTGYRVAYAGSSPTSWTCGP